MLSDAQKQVFGNLLRAGENDQFILLECKRARDGKIVSVICGTYHDGESYLIFPYAELIDPANGEPTEQYYPPDENDKEKFVEPVAKVIDAEEFQKHRVSVREER